ncbi:MAG: hypothetical protein PW843_29525 [Azospirillaceae bacterium]|nr:hypothetical protein [Azospirillaceae bacterium]
MFNTATFTVPANTNIHIDGFFSAGWVQQIVVESPAGKQTWTSTANSNNTLAGQIQFKTGNAEATVSVQMSYMLQGDYAPSTVVKIPLTDPALQGYVIGGQDGGPRPTGPAAINTVVLAFWAAKY